MGLVAAAFGLSPGRADSLSPAVLIPDDDQGGSVVRFNLPSAGDADASCGQPVVTGPGVLLGTWLSPCRASGSPLVRFLSLQRKPANLRCPVSKPDDPASMLADCGPSVRFFASPLSPVRLEVPRRMTCGAPFA